MSDVRELFERLTDIEPTSSASEILERAERRASHLAQRRTRRTFATVGLVAVLIVGAVLVAAHAGSSDRGTHVPTERGPSTPTTPPSNLYEVDAPVEQSGTNPPVLCLGPQLKSFGSICGGIPIAGWDWANVPDKHTSNGVTSGDYHLVGTYNGTTFTSTEPPTAEHPTPQQPLPSFQPPCPTPTGGWVDVDPSRMKPRDFNAFSAAAQNEPDSAGLWIDHSQTIYTVAFTGGLDRHRAQLRALWGGPICVVQHQHSTAQLNATLNSLIGGAGRHELALGPLVGGGTDPVDDVVQLQVVALTPAIRAAVNRKYGFGLVDITGYLTPLPDATSGSRSSTVHSDSRTCGIRDLALHYYGGQATDGNDYGVIAIRDVSASPCLLPGPVVVSGRSRSDDPVTTTVTYFPATAIRLSARATLPPDTRPGESVANLKIWAEYRDDNSTPTGACRNRIVPTTWRLSFWDGSLMVPNVSHDAGAALPSLLTCKGGIDTPALPIAQSSTPGD